MRKNQDKINDKKTISKAKIIHLWNFNTSGAMDINSHFKLIAYPREKSVLNGCAGIYESSPDCVRAGS